MKQGEQKGAGCIVLLMILFWVGAFVFDYSSGLTVFGVLASIAIFLWIGISGNLQEKKISKQANEAFAHVVIDHSHALWARRQQLLVKDRYGVVDMEKWVSELMYFWEKVVVPELGIEKSALLEKLWQSECPQKIDNILLALPRNSVDFTSEFTGTDPIEFEHHCAKLLRTVGWDARVTQGSNDQGTDVIAIKNGLKLVLQCKLYSKPVGNKAVQEAAAAKAHENADIAAVVTNNTYTNAAKSLGNTNDIALLHYLELQHFAEQRMPN